MIVFKSFIPVNYFDFESTISKVQLFYLFIFIFMISFLYEKFYSHCLTYFHSSSCKISSAFLYNFLRISRIIKKESRHIFEIYDISLTLEFHLIF